jgi:D-tyrosyl-tRNA(Tyr) deacylase
MRAVLQRVSSARVIVKENTTGSIQRGLLIFLGITHTDTTAEADYVLNKSLTLRIFEDEAGKMNRSVVDVGGSLLIVSQFTLYSDCRKGRRPAFDLAAPVGQARDLYDYFVNAARRGPVPVETGVFQADMQVELVNSGPVTILLDSAER